MPGMKPGMTLRGQNMIKRDDIVGVYRQLGEDAVNAAGEITYTNNERSSQIMYSADGYVGVISAPAGRKKVSGSDNRTDLNGATVEERAEAASGLTCYAGHYQLKDGAVHHHIEMALNPNLIGQTLIRRVHLDGADLTLSSVPDKDGNYRRIRWRRVGAK
jgi:hypothetical protein